MVASALAYIFGGTTITTLIAFFVYWRLNKRQKVAEVKGAEEDTEAKTIQNESSKLDLGDRYIESILKLQNTFENNTTVVKELADKIDRVLDAQTRTARLVEYMRLYLDGPFDEWLKNNGFTNEDTKL